MLAFLNNFAKNNNDIKIEIYYFLISDKHSVLWGLIKKSNVGFISRTINGDLLDLRRSDLEVYTMNYGSLTKLRYYCKYVEMWKAKK